MTARAALGLRTTEKPRTTAASDGQGPAQVSRRFRAFAQVVRAPGLSLARRKSGRVLNPGAAGGRALGGWSYRAGLMLLFNRNKLSGSYRCLTSTSRGRLSP